MQELINRYVDRTHWYQLTYIPFLREKKKRLGQQVCLLLSDAKLELELPEPIHFVRSRSQSRNRRNDFFGAGVEAGVVKNRAATAP